MDASSAATAAIPRKEGVPVASPFFNRGKGNALRTGFAIASSSAPTS